MKLRDVRSVCETSGSERSTGENSEPWGFACIYICTYTIARVFVITSAVHSQLTVSLRVSHGCGDKGLDRPFKPWQPHDGHSWSSLPYQAQTTANMVSFPLRPVPSNPFEWTPPAGPFPLTGAQRVIPDHHKRFREGRPPFTGIYSRPLIAQRWRALAAALLQLGGEINVRHVGGSPDSRVVRRPMAAVSLPPQGFFKAS